MAAKCASVPVARLESIIQDRSQGPRGESTDDEALRWRFQGRGHGKKREIKKSSRVVCPPTPTPPKVSHFECGDSFTLKIGNIALGNVNENHFYVHHNKSKFKNKIKKKKILISCENTF